MGADGEGVGETEVMELAKLAIRPDAAGAADGMPRLECLWLTMEGDDDGRFGREEDVDAVRE